MNKFSRFFLFFVIFLGFSRMTMPMAHSLEVETLYPWWAKSIQFGNLFLFEAIFIIWLPFFGLKFVLNYFYKKSPGKIAILSLIYLAIWTGLISIIFSPLPIHDLARSSRLLVNSLIFIVVYNWSIEKPFEVLMASVSGLFYGSIINLIMTFTYPLIINESIRLAGQNTVGVAVAIGIHLTAFWYLLSTTKISRIFCLLSCIFFSLICGFSFSRIGWFIGISGILAWLIVLAIKKYNYRKVSFMSRSIKLFFSIFILGFSLSFFPIVRHAVGHIFNLVDQKFNIYAKMGDGDKQRLAYLKISLLIVEKSPLGVGYSGYYNAQKNIAPFIDEAFQEVEGNYEANPHSALLYYFTSGGIIGGILTILCFSFFCLLLFKSFWILNPGIGFFLALLLVFSYLIIILTVTYIFNSFIFIIPIALIAASAFNKINQRFNVYLNYETKTLESR